jgi:hypothetical protein
VGFSFLFYFFFLSFLIGTLYIDHGKNERKPSFVAQAAED